VSRARRRRDPAPVGNLVGRYRRGTRPPQGTVAALGPLAAAWPEAAGRLADRSAPIRRSRDGVVTVACADAATAQALAYRADDLADALAARTGQPVPGLRVVVADHALTPPPSAPPAPPAPPSPAARAAAEGLVAGVGDEHLRDLLARAAAASLERGWRREEGDAPAKRGIRQKGGAEGAC